MEILRHATDLDRTVIGGAVPATEPLKLGTHPELCADYFLECSELGVLNVGGSGIVTVYGQNFKLDKLDCLYVGRGSKSVSLASEVGKTPAAFYLPSYPAHTQHPTRLAKFTELEPVTWDPRKHATSDRFAKPSFLMAFAAASWSWDSHCWRLARIGIRCHDTHMRSSEVYFYFDVDRSQRVMHLKEPPQETIHLQISDREVVVGVRQSHN
jgi:4-deoxy-L-threo-5-hexosulose-uronate ketol-isomerase